jgi:hypothetical protein
MNQQQQYGIKRTISRPGRTSYVRIEELLCPCCGNLTRVEWEQECFNKPPIIETHCENKGCPAYFQTMDKPSFYERFGSTSHIPQSTAHLSKETSK